MTNAEKQRLRAALVEGMLTGQYTGIKIKNSSGSNTINNKPLKISKYTQIGITAGSKYLANRNAQSVQIPIMCTGAFNATILDNTGRKITVGIGAFASKITWNSELTYTGITVGDFGSNISIDATHALTDRYVIVVGLNDSDRTDTNDFVLYYINFQMQTVDTSINKIYITPIMSNGQSNYDCSLLTYASGTLSYIVPIEVNPGYIYFDHEYSPSGGNPSGPFNGPDYFPMNTSTDGGGGSGGASGGSSANYSLTGYLGGAGGSGAWIVTKIYSDGILIGTDRQWVTTGNFSISHSINLNVTDRKYEKITGDITVEPEEGDDTPYYLLIPANGFTLNIVTTIADSDPFPDPDMIVICYDKLEFTDDISIEIETYEIQEVDGAGNSWVLNDAGIKDKTSINITDSENGDNITFTDTADISDFETITIYSQECMEQLQLDDGADTPIIYIAIADADFDEQIEYTDSSLIEFD